MRRKSKTVLKGYLLAEDVRKMNTEDPTLKAYWNKVKHNLIILGDPINEKVYFLNNELTKLAKKYEGVYVKITIEPLYGKEAKLPDGKIMDPEEEYKGFEKFKQTIFSVFKID